MSSVSQYFCSGLIIRVCLVIGLGFVSAFSKADDLPLKVVTTFSVLADMAQQIGKEHVSVKALVGWDEDAHVFQPSPGDVKQIANADLLVLNGLGFEGWLARLLSAAEYTGASVVASEGVSLIHLDNAPETHKGHDHDHEHVSNVYDPHAWHSLNAALVYVDNIAKGLIKADPKNEQDYLANLKSYSDKLKGLDFSIAHDISKIPPEKRRLVVPHNAFAYLARDYDLHIYSLQGLSTDSEASAADLAKIVRLIRSLKIKAIFTETISDKRLIQVVESETDATIEGALVSGALSRELAPTYLDVMQYNSDLIIKALTKN
jgi:zinc/manganese transport system substrate-binding protein|tara:strand:+ start:3639 stop:4592 length:954 start_codon:yes stop_codon:yes gene_type:complete